MEAMAIQPQTDLQPDLLQDFLAPVEREGLPPGREEAHHLILPTTLQLLVLAFLQVVVAVIMKGLVERIQRPLVVVFTEVVLVGPIQTQVPLLAVQAV
jgi:hypothetical protein